MVPLCLDAKKGGAGNNKDRKTGDDQHFAPTNLAALNHRGG
jgi:hypothetical protein